MGIYPTDGYQDRNGELLLRCAQELSLEIVNLHPDCEGESTWCAHNSQSTIDYALVSPRLAARLTQMHIDEDGHFSLGSDHNRLRLSFPACTHKPNRMQPQAATPLAPVNPFNKTSCPGVRGVPPEEEGADVLSICAHSAFSHAHPHGAG